MDNSKTGRAVNQEDWKRTQIRMPQDYYEQIMAYAEANNISLNTAMLDLIEKSLHTNETNRLNLSEADVRVFNLPDGIRRVVYGKFVNSLDLDYSRSLEDLQHDINLALSALQRSSLLKKIAFFNKNVLVYRGGHHIDVVDDGEKSLNWLTIEDHRPLNLED